MVRELPKIEIGAITYFIDDNLGELRNINNPHDVRVLTCRDCVERDSCPLVDDPYNIDGDCLMSK